MRGAAPLALAAALLLAALAAALLPAAQAGAAEAQPPRFPHPEFRSDYKVPSPTAPLPERSGPLQALDAAVLAASLGLGAYLALVRRSRRGLFLLGLFALLYFGFWKKGCLCPVGSVQNVAAALSDPAAVLPLSAAALFVLPLVVALFAGRTFCAAACPLGAVQDVVAVRPLPLPPALSKALGFLPVLYLGVAALFASLGAGFVVCRYDPFVGFLRLSGETPLLAAGLALLVLGTVVARPYCRFLCPYGVLLRWASALSRRRVTVTPDRCVQCRLCEDACPFGAIRPATLDRVTEDRGTARRRLALSLALLPLLAAGGGALGHAAREPLSRVHPVVALDEEIRREEAGGLPGSLSLRSEAFRESARPAADLAREARVVRERFGFGSTLLGAFLGLALGGRLVSLSRRPRREAYEPEAGECLSCGRCFRYCPVEHLRLSGAPADYERLREVLASPAARTAVRDALPAGDVRGALAEHGALPPGDSRG